MSDQMFSGKYIVQEVLAKGGMGVIYKALDRTIDRVVVIKVVHEHLSGDPSFTERFLREARAMGRLAHENIIRIYAVEEEERGTPYIVMEYCSGGNLRSFMQAHKPLQLRTSLEIALQVAEALAYAHEQGLVHRDIKPANILIDGHGRVKLTDFGIAAALDEAAITTVGQIIGTAEYMSPEQASGRKVDGRADLYSLGIVLYEMIVGRHPFQHIPKNAIHSRPLETEGEIPLVFPDTVPSLVRAIIEDLVRRDPEYRTATARLVASQLKECLQTLPPPHEPVGEEPTILVHLPPIRREETRRMPTGPEPPNQVSTPSFPFPSEKDAPSRKGEVPFGPGPPPPEDETDVLIKESAKSKPVTHQESERLWRRYNILPLVAATVTALMVSGGIVFFLSRTEWLESPHPSGPPQKERPVDILPTSERDENADQPGKTKPTEGQDEAPIPPPTPQPPLTPPKVASRQPEGKSPLTPSRRQLDKLLRDFQAAYEAQDLTVLQQMSDISPDRQLFLDMMSHNYSSIKTSIRDIELRDNQATAVLIHEELIDKKGERVAPDPILRSVRITVRKEADRWSKVVW